MYNTVHDRSPICIIDITQVYRPCRMLRSQSSLTLVISQTFIYAAPGLQNPLLSKTGEPECIIPIAKDSHFLDNFVH